MPPTAFVLGFGVIETRRLFLNIACYTHRKSLTSNTSVVI
jgi:hypothetical protein